MLAVSGGPDSTALMNLVAAWRTRPSLVWVASVDHGLQDGSHAVANAVLAQAAGLGLPGRVLAWAGEKPKRGLQAQARAARYRMLEDFCREIGASHLVLAHTLDDQAETVLMRLAAGSGLRGLAAMRPDTEQGEITWARPLLRVRKAALVELCAREGWPFEVDRANTDPRFARSRWRRLARGLATEGLTPERLARLAERAARADAALNAAVSRLQAQTTLPRAPGTLGFDATTLLSAPDEIALRVLAGALETLSPATPQRLDRLESLFAQLRAARPRGEALHRTLQGCLVTLDRQGCLQVRREPPRRRGRASDPPDRPFRIR